MGLSLGTFTTGTAISASDLNARVVSVEDFLNEGIVQGDLDSAAWVATRHLYKPEFYGAPAPRCHAVSGDVHWRMAPHHGGYTDLVVFHPEVVVGEWLPVPGLCARIHIDSNAADVSMDIVATFHATEEYGVGAGVESNLAADFALFLDGAAIVATVTEREIFNNGDALGERMGQQDKSHVITWTKLEGTLTAGVHHLGVRIRPSSGNQELVKHIIVRGRSLLVDLHYK